MRGHFRVKIPSARYDILRKIQLCRCNRVNISDQTTITRTDNPQRVCCIQLPPNNVIEVPSNLKDRISPKRIFIMADCYLPHKPKSNVEETAAYETKGCEDFEEIIGTK